MDSVRGIWDIAQATNSTKLITACLTILATDVPRLLEMKLTVDQLKEVLRLPSIKRLGGEQQLRLVTNLVEAEASNSGRIGCVDLLDSLLPLVDLNSITDDAAFDFMGENNAIVTNPQCR